MADLFINSEKDFSTLTLHKKVLQDNSPCMIVLVWL